jgi:co-chaperonin GroES (HSP10)
VEAVTVRPLQDGILVRMDPPREMTAGGLHIPEQARADAGTWRAQREAKVGTVLAVGPGRHKARRTGWERDKRKRGVLSTEEREAKYDRGSAGVLVPMDVKVGDRVLFEPSAELQAVDPSDPLLRMGAQFQVAAVLDVSDDEEMGA